MQGPNTFNSFYPRSISKGGSSSSSTKSSSNGLDKSSKKQNQEDEEEEKFEILTSKGLIIQTVD